MLSVVDIRYATPNDVQTMFSLFEQVVRPLEIYSIEARAGEIEKFSPPNLLTRIANDPKAVSIAYLDDAPAGFSITDDQHGPIWLEWYGTLPIARGHGVGEKLVRRLIEEAPARGATKLWCDTRVNNTASIGLFEKLGFVRLCDLTNHWYGQDFYLWERVV